MIIHLLQYTIAWLDWPEAIAAISIAASSAHFWLTEKRESRAEARRDNAVDELKYEFKEMKENVNAMGHRLRELEEE